MTRRVRLLPILLIVYLLQASLAHAGGKVLNPANGHWYELVDRPFTLTWTQCRDSAFSLGGHLATIANSSENTFVIGLDGPIGAIFLGGSGVSDGGWHWISGEPFGAFNAWNSGEPSSGPGEDFLELFKSGPATGTWNNVPDNTNEATSFCVEYENNCKYDGSLMFDGVSDSMTLPISALNNLSQGTVEAWVYFTDINSSPCSEFFIIDRSWYESVYWGDLRLGKERGNAPNAHKFYFSLDNGNTRLYSITTAIDGVWYHVAGTWDGTTWRIIVNGIEEGSLLDPRTLSDRSNGRVYIGKIIGDNPDYECIANGLIDEVRFSDVARNTGDFCLSAPCASGVGTIGLWHLDESTGEIAPDATGAHDGSVNGANWYHGCKFDLPSDSVFFPPVAVAPCDSGVSIQPVKVNLSKPAVGGVVTFKIPAGVSVVGIDQSGLVTQDWDNVQYSPQAGYAFARLNNQLGLRLQADTATILFIKFKFDRLCRQDKIIHWDTAQSTDPSRRTAFTDTLFSTFYPDFDNTHDSTRVLGYEPGDLDNSGGVDIADLSALIDYLYISFTPPCLLSAANVADFPLSNIDISDLSRLIDYLYISFLPLQCPSAAAEKSSTNQLEVEYVVNAQVSEGVTTISTFARASLRGLQLELSGPEGEMPFSLAGDNLKVYCGWKDGVLYVGIIDPTGKQFINAGNTPLIQLNGEFKILSATVADMEHRSVRPQIGASAGTTLPTEYSLSQNYPNPFNPATTISFSLPAAGHVTVKVYNSIGQEVATLIDEDRPAGAHQVLWDATKFASGVYLYRLTSDGFTETKKMLLMK